MDTLLRTNRSTSNLMLRLVLGAVMFPHGAQKLLGWFGGHGYSATMGFLTRGMHLPAPVAVLVIMAEFFGALGLVTGTLTRVAAAGVAAVMLGAVATVHWHNGFFMNWAGTQHGEGFEYHLLALAMAGVLVATGGGRLSVDGWLARRMDSRSGARRGLTTAHA